MIARPRWMHVVDFFFFLRLEAWVVVPKPKGLGCYPIRIDGSGAGNTRCDGWSSHADDEGGRALLESWVGLKYTKQVIVALPSAQLFSLFPARGPQYERRRGTRFMMPSKVSGGGYRICITKHEHQRQDDRFSKILSKINKPPLGLDSDIDVS